MIIKYLLVSALATPAAAQTIPCMLRGAGSMYGVAGYDCANCGFKQEEGQRPTYIFYAAPVVTVVDRGSKLQAGDVVEAVDNLPITTAAGAEHFAYPEPGTHTVTIRRGRDRTTLGGWVFQRPACQITVDGSSVSVATTSGGGSATATVSGVAVTTSGGFGAGGGRARGGSGRAATAAGGGAGGGSAATVVGDTAFYSTGSGSNRPVVVIDGVVQDDDSRASRFGFAVECVNSCHMSRASNGREYFKYDDYPRIIAVRRESAAARAGLRVGDRITEVNGRSVTDEMGRLERATEQESIKLTVLRDNKPLYVNMVVTRSEDDTVE